MVTELITADSGKTKASPKPLKGAMKVIKKLKGRIGLGESTLFFSVFYSSSVVFLFPSSARSAVSGTRWSTIRDRNFPFLFLRHTRKKIYNWSLYIWPALLAIFLSLPLHTHTRNKTSTDRALMMFSGLSKNKNLFRDSSRDGFRPVSFRGFFFFVFPF